MWSNYKILLQFIALFLATLRMERCSWLETWVSMIIDLMFGRLLTISKSCMNATKAIHLLKAHLELLVSQVIGLQKTCQGIFVLIPSCLFLHVLFETFSCIYHFSIYSILKRLSIFNYGNSFILYFISTIGLVHPYMTIKN